MLKGFGDERDGKVVEILDQGRVTSLVNGKDYRANVSSDRLEMLDDGAAGIKVNLSKGMLTVRHCENNQVLIHRPVKDGFWANLWEQLQSL